MTRNGRIMILGRLNLEAPDISYFSLALFYLLLLIPLAFALYLKVDFIKREVIAVSRLTIQLLLIGIVLTFLFESNSTPLNILWFFIIVGFASFSAINNSELNWRKTITPVAISILLSGMVMVLIFNSLLLRLENLFEARYFIILSGMIIGNSLKAIVIGMSAFFEDLKKNEKQYLYLLSFGENVTKTVRPFFRNSFKAALNPTIASMATVGLVFIPGMMSGQIISGLSAEDAIKYQIAIYLAIFVGISIAVFLTIFFSLKKSFDDYGALNKDIFK